MARKRLVGLLRDLFVYAPIGFLVEAPRLVPELVEVGRRRVSGGATPRRGRAHRRPAPPGPPPDRPAVPPTHDAPPERGGRPAGEDLAIPGYDQLAASQVVARLSGLSSAALDRVEAYERAHRGRRTVLAKIKQLRGS